MTLMEKIEAEIKLYENLVQDCEKEIREAEIKKQCYQDALESLKEINYEARREQSSDNNTIEEKSNTKTPRKKKIATDNTDAKEIQSNNASISMKSLAEELNKSTTEIANACNQLNLNEEIAHNNYCLTPEQAERIKNHFTSES